MRLLLVLVASLFWVAPAAAQNSWSSPVDGAANAPTAQSETGTIRFSSQLGFYDNGDSGDGNPFLDESLTVIEPVVLWDHSVSDDWGYSFKLSYDNVSAASIDRLSQFPAQSGASGDFYVGADFASRHRLESGNWWSWNTHLSVEYDYVSLGLGAGYSREHADGAKTTWNLNSFFDTIDIIRSDGDESEGSDNRTSIAANWSHARVLTPVWNGELSATLAAQFGFLETPYNFVAVQDGVGTFPFDNGVVGTALDEALPDSRIRLAVAGRARRWLAPGKAVELGSRLYADDWGILGISLEPRLYLPLGEDVDLRLRYRFYTQSEADDFVGEVVPPAASAPRFRTSDTDLSSFSSNSLGLRFDFGRDRPSGWFVDANYLLRDDGLDQTFFSIGLRRSF